jgi:cytochrome c biogenesis protein CcdA
VLALAFVVVSIGLIDSLNPTTIVPALYFAASPQPGRRTLGFAAGVFAINMLGGAVLLLGPGRAVIAALPHPAERTQHLIELVLAAAALLAAAAVWLARERLNNRFAAPTVRASRGSLVAGATIAAVELPTAVPYFGVIAAVAASRASVPLELAMLALFNIAFVAPLALIAALGHFSSERAPERMNAVHAFIVAHLGGLLAMLLIVIAIALAAVGAVGIAG